MADLLEAETETQRRVAITSAEGALSRDLHAWMDRLSEARAMIEAMIDFDNEDEVSARPEEVCRALATLVDDLDQVVARATVERLREGFRIVIAGPRNAGKSSLFNALLERDAAIVTPIAGTTRDRIEASVVRSGQVFTLIDTAGLTERTNDPVEIEGIGRSHAAIAGADLVLWLGDDSPSDPGKSLWLRPRCDESGREQALPGQVMAVSVRQPDKIGALWPLLSAKAASAIGVTEGYLLQETQRAVITRVVARCRQAWVERDLLLSAEELRVASRDLGKLLGFGETDAMFNALFSRFCLGK